MTTSQKACNLAGREPDIGTDIRPAYSRFHRFLPKIGLNIASQSPMAEEQRQVFQTRLLLHKTGKSANDRLLFGRPVSSSNRSKSTTEHSFNSGQIFGFVRWRGDGYGTQTWRVVLAEAGVPKEPLTRIPGIDPGAHLLLHAFGKTRVKRALRAIDGLAERHVLQEIAPAYWHHVNLQISQNLPLEPYDEAAFKRLKNARSVS